MTDEAWFVLADRLAKSKFRSRFKLVGKDLETARLQLSTGELRCKAEQWLEKKLFCANPVNDGKQTPMRGYPVFVAQHATATCCRGCLEKWHRIPQNRPLTNEERELVLDIIIRWIEAHALLDN
jgi:hypothetical protein